MNKNNRPTLTLKPRTEVVLTAKCTGCQKTYILTSMQLDEAARLGCPMSPCCAAVATVQKAALRGRPR